jgi:hypothetical protein
MCELGIIFQIELKKKGWKYFLKTNIYVEQSIAYNFRSQLSFKVSKF